MKRKLGCFILIFMFMFLCACTKRAVLVYDEPSKEAAVESELQGGEKLQGKIEYATAFSEGKAFVKVLGDDKNYCINKKGQIIFELGGMIFISNSSFGAKVNGFYKGITLISDIYGMAYTTICDKNGKITTATDMGVGTFYPDAAKDGYIITFTEISGQLGVLNHKLEWVVKPSRELAVALGIKEDNGARNLALYYKDNILYTQTGCVDITTGDVISGNFESKGIAKHSKDSKNWNTEDYGFSYNDGQKNYKMVDVSNIGYTDCGYCTTKIEGGGFVDGKAPVVFGDIDKWTHFSVIDEKGKAQFVPVNFGNYISRIYIADGKILVIGKSGGKAILKTYDMKGNKIGELKNVTEDLNTAYYFNDSMVVVKQSGLTGKGVEKTAAIYDINLKSIF